MSLENASPELQLAVDLIYLLECNEIAPATVLIALDIVKKDYEKKMLFIENSLMPSPENTV